MLSSIINTKKYWNNFDSHFKNTLQLYKRELVLFGVWFLIAAFLDIHISIIGFLTIGIQYEKNSIVITAWQNGSFLQLYLRYFLFHLLATYFLIYCLIFVKYFLNQKGTKKFYLFWFPFVPVGFFAGLAVEHLNQVILWIMAILLRSKPHSILYIPCYIINLIIFLKLVDNFSTPKAAEGEKK